MRTSLGEGGAGAVNVWEAVTVAHAVALGLPEAVTVDEADGSGEPVADGDGVSLEEALGIEREGSGELDANAEAVAAKPVCEWVKEAVAEPTDALEVGVAVEEAMAVTETLGGSVTEALPVALPEAQCEARWLDRRGEIERRQCGSSPLKEWRHGCRCSRCSRG